MSKVSLKLSVSPSVFTNISLSVFISLFIVYKNFRPLGLTQSFLSSDHFFFVHETLSIINEIFYVQVRCSNFAKIQQL